MPRTPRQHYYDDIRNDTISDAVYLSIYSQCRIYIFPHHDIEPIRLLLKVAYRHAYITEESRLYRRRGTDYAMYFYNETVI